jgi:hypothetical protein
VVCLSSLDDFARRYVQWTFFGGEVYRSKENASVEIGADGWHL